MVYSLVLRPTVVIFGALYRRTPYFWIQTIEKRVLIFTVLDKITIRNPKMPLQLKPKKCGSKTRRYVFRMDYLDPVYRVSSHSIRKSGLCSGCNGVKTSILFYIPKVHSHPLWGLFLSSKTADWFFFRIYFRNFSKTKVSWNGGDMGSTEGRF